jgi:hypothetical protein
VYGNIHGCVDFLFVAQVISVSFSGYFRQILSAACSFDFEVFGFGFVCGIMDRCPVHLCG